jgi:hypothetical protein
MKHGKIKVAIIDDGVNEKIFNVQLANNVEISPQLNVVQRAIHSPHLINHGTICSAIIVKYVAEEVLLSSVKILNEGKGGKEQLIMAIKWCEENGINVASLSLGTVDFRDFKELRNVINRAYKKGIIIVAAGNNKGIFTCPASYSNVIGVKCDKHNLLTEGQYIYNEYSLDGIEITANATNTLTDSTGKEILLPNCNSYAAPVITAKVCDLLNDFPELELEQIKNYFKKTALNGRQTEFNEYFANKIDWIERALVFNLYKNSYFRTSKLHCYIKGKEDIQCNTLEEGLKGILDYLIQKKIIMEKIDTYIIIVNGLETNRNDTNLSIFMQLMDSWGKNIVFLDDSFPKYSQSIKLDLHNIKVHNPFLIDRDQHTVTSESKMKIPLPIITVYDFSERELIYFLSELMECFRRDGYNTIGIADTCQGIYAGIEYIPINSYLSKASKGSISQKIRAFIDVYPTDVILLGINAKNKNAEYIEQVEKMLDIDMRVLIKCKSFYQFNKNIVTMLVNTAFSGENTYQNMKAFNYQDSQYIKQLYRCIIDNFENDR